MAVLAALRRRSERLAEALERVVPLRVPLLGGCVTLREMMNLTFAVETLTGGGFAVEDARGEAGAWVGGQPGGGCRGIPKPPWRAC